MFEPKTAFSGFSVNDLAKAKEFYTQTLGLQVVEEGVGLRLHLPGGGTAFAYPKDDHQPATFTLPRVTQRDRESAEKEPAKGYEQRVCPHRVTGKREIQLA